MNSYLVKVCLLQLFQYIGIEGFTAFQFNIFKIAEVKKLEMTFARVNLTFHYDINVIY